MFYFVRASEYTSDELLISCVEEVLSSVLFLYIIGCLSFNLEIYQLVIVNHIMLLILLTPACDLNVSLTFICVNRTIWSERIAVLVYGST